LAAWRSIRLRQQADRNTSYEDLQTLARSKPFVPFRVVLTTGEKYDIRHPDLIMVGKRSAVLGITNDPAGTAYDRAVHVDLLRVVAVETGIASPASSNGPAV
jgi:hypothetical protein